MAVDVSALIAANRAAYERGVSPEHPTKVLTPQDLPSPTGEHNRRGFERHIVLSDYHHRNYTVRDWITGQQITRSAHDARALAVAEAFAQAWQPTHIHFLGDMLDFHSVSKFCKSAPDSTELNESIRTVRSIFEHWREMFPDAGMDFELGNHDIRWSTYIEERAGALAGLDILTYQSILGARDLGLTIYPYKERVQILPQVLEITHGDVVRNKSGLSAHAMLEKGISGVSGHTHRLGMVYRTTRAGTRVWAENGCLADMNPTYMSDPDWQQGFTIAVVDRANGRFHLDQIPILTTAGNRRRAVYAGEVYESDGGE